MLSKQPSYIICHYSEIALKGNNRTYFEKQLKDNIKISVDSKIPDSIKYIGRLFQHDAVIGGQVGLTLDAIDNQRVETLAVRPSGSSEPWVLFRVHRDFTAYYTAEEVTCP